MAYTDYTWITDRLAIGAWIAEPEDLPFDALRPAVFPNVAFEVPLRLAAGEQLSEAWLDRRLANFTAGLLAQFGVEVDPQRIRERLEEQGTLAHIGAPAGR